MTDLITFQTFNTFQEASEIEQILLKNGIHTAIVKTTPVFDAVLMGNSGSDMYELKMDGSDFEKARTVLYNSPNFKIEDVNSSHPLYEMTDNELRDIISKPDEWGPENYNIALFLLRNRGLTISDETLNKLQDERLNTLSEKKHMSTYVLVIGYMTALMPVVANFLSDHEKDGKILWYFPGLMGLVISWVITQTKMTLPNGKRVPAYPHSVLTHGLVIFALNVLSWVVNFLIFTGMLF